MNNTVIVSDIIIGVKPEMIGRENIENIFKKIKTEADKKHEVQHNRFFTSIMNMIKEQIQPEEIEQKIKESKERHFTKYVLRGRSGRGETAGETAGFLLSVAGNRLFEDGYKRLLKVKKEVDEIEKKETEKKIKETKIRQTLVNHFLLK